VCGTSSSANRAPSSWDSLTPHRTQTCSSSAVRRTAPRWWPPFAKLGFDLTDAQAAEILRGKDFVQLKNGPFDLDLVFAPDGIDGSPRRGHAASRSKASGVPSDDIIASKAATNRVKDRESLRA